jgi:hypothetical protein
MGFKTVETTLSAAVATNGTFTVSYPSGTRAGSFAGAWAHKMWAAGHQKLYEAPGGFTVSFGATEITVTYKGTTSLPQGGRVRMEFDTLSDNAREPEKALVLDNVVKANMVLLDLGAPIAADSDGVAASQSVAQNASFVLNGALVSNGVAVFDVPRNVVGAWTTNAILTITGYDVDGNLMVEKTPSAAATHTGTKAFMSVISVSSDTAITAATVGTGVVIGLPRFVPDASYIRAEYKDGTALARMAEKVFLPYEIEQTELLAATSEELVSPVAGRISRHRGIVQGAVTTGGDVTVEVNTTAVDGLTLTIANADAKGTRYADTPTAGHASAVVAKGDRIEIQPAAAIDTAGQLNGVLEIDVSAAGQLDGTFVAGVVAVATATTGDTRGTYSPSTAPDGSGYRLLAVLPDPSNEGVPQYAG